MDSPSNDELKAAYHQVSSETTDVSERDLWAPMMRELLRKGGGPEACVEHLEAERTRMILRIREALDRLDASEDE